VGAGKYGYFAADQRRKGQAVDDLLAGVADMDIRDMELCCHDRRFRIKITKTGTPINEVTIPTGTIAPATITLLRMDASDMMKAQGSMLSGHESRWSSPISRSAICRPTSPVKRMRPGKATAPAGSRLMRSSDSRRSLRALTPKL